MTCVFVMPILIWKNKSHHIKCNRYNHEEAINRFILPEITLLMKCTHYLEDVLLILTLTKKPPKLLLSLIH